MSPRTGRTSLALKPLLYEVLRSCCVLMTPLSRKFWASNLGPGDPLGKPGDETVLRGISESIFRNAAHYWNACGEFCQAIPAKRNIAIQCALFSFRISALSNHHTDLF